jgi:hypothetical protein
VQSTEAATFAEKDVLVTRDLLPDDVVKAGIESVRFFRGSPVRITDPQLARIDVPTISVGRPGDGFIVESKVGRGSVVVLGTSMWWYWISPPIAKGADNAKLMRWLLSPSKKD